MKFDEKNNEIAAILALLGLESYLVSLGAMGCQKSIAQMIVDKEAYYLLTGKVNEGKLHEAVKEVYRGNDCKHNSRKIGREK